MTNEQIDAVARRVVEMLRAERDGVARAALRGLSARLDDIAAQIESARDHIDRLAADLH